MVKKDLMLEPKTPRFANQGDTFNSQVLVQNASTYSGTWEVKFGTGAGSGTPVRGSTGANQPDRHPRSGRIGNRRLPHPRRRHRRSGAHLAGDARFARVGKSNTGSEAQPFRCRRSAFPGRSIRCRCSASRSWSAFRRSSEKRDLRAAARPQSAGRNAATVDLEFSRSPLLEAAGSVDYLLHYPYGCVEQTTSSLIPWLAVEDLSPVIPKFAAMSEKKVAAAIQAGADRLLSMQLPDGSFTYWPGGTQTVPWATPYAGLGLLMAVGKGRQRSRVRHRGTHQKSHRKPARPRRGKIAVRLGKPCAFVAGALARGSSPQVAYQNKLVDRIAELTPSARSLLAAAIALADEDNAANLAKAKSVLMSKVAVQIQKRRMDAMDRR